MIKVIAKKLVNEGKLQKVINLYDELAEASRKVDINIYKQLL